LPPFPPSSFFPVLTTITTTTNYHHHHHQVDEVPEGFAMETIVWVSKGGVNQAMEEWGRSLRKAYRVRRGAVVVTEVVGAAAAAAAK